MAGPVQVGLTISPRLLHDAVARSLDGHGVEVTSSPQPLVSVVTPDHAGDTGSKVVIVLGDGPAGEVRIVVDGELSEERRIEIGDLPGLVIDLTQELTHDEPPCAHLEPPSTLATDPTAP